MTQSITVANDDTLTDLIRSVTRRLVLLAPAVSRRVAEAIIDRWNALPPDAVSVVLDMDPEVYRLGYGDPDALLMLEEAARSLQRALNRQLGIRIGLLLADDTVMVYAPTPLLIEAGPRRPDTPNAVVLGALPDPIAAELGQGPRGLTEQTIGLDRVELGQIKQVREDLKRNPPRKFDIARTERVFNAHFEFVEFELTGTAVHRKEVSIPSELMGLATDHATQSLLKTSFRLVDPSDEISGKHLEREKGLIAAAFLKPLKGYGSAILRTDRPTFEREVEKLRAAVDTFKQTVRNRLQTAIERNREALKAALLPRVIETPPTQWIRADGSKPDPALVERWLDQVLRRAFGTADRVIGDMKVRVVFKGVTYDSLKDPEFFALATKAMPGLQALHREYDAAPASEPEDDPSSSPSV